MPIWLALCWGVIGLFPEVVRAQNPQGLAAAVSLERVLVDVIHRAEPSIVSIARVRPGANSGRFNGLDVDPEGRFEADRPENPDFVPNEFGAGVVIVPPGGSGQRYILTNYHVVHGGPTAKGGGESQIYVRFGDRRGYYAQIVAGDPRSDLAILAIDYTALGLKPTDLKPITLRSETSPLEKGQLVIGLGNPYAIARDGSATASWGMLSNISRRPAPTRVREFGLPQSDLSIHQFGTLLQVDTRMELGTSGGALVNLRGELIGITTSLAALEGYERSAGFAIPIDEFTRRVIETLCHGYEVEYGFLGLTLKTVLPDQLRRRYGVNFKQASAVEVKTIYPNSPAAIAQVRQEDLILELEGHPLLDQFDLMRYVALYGPEATVRLKIWRPSESTELTLAAKLAKWPVMEEDAIIATSRRYPPWRGLIVDYPTGRYKYFGWPPQFRDAVVIGSVGARSPAQSAGLVEGDFIASVNAVPVHTPSEFQEAVRGADGPVTLELVDHRKITVQK
ncbi:MAG TPA: trypsin-like peptidase domain-containing protein [Planctomycetaceae bacterium]|nr:trypsin-like peptidase domain-containing protein [Planctomycetaceae bacterium]